jgi:hypothetical protein
MTKSPATFWNAGRFIGVIVRVDIGVRRSMRQCCRGVKRMGVSRRAATFFPVAASYRFCGDRGGPVGSKWSSARIEVRGGRRREVREGKGREQKRGRELWEKAAGDECVFIPGEGPGLADEVGSDAIPNAAGGEGGHGAAKLDPVIHRYVFNHTITSNRSSGSRAGAVSR